MDETITRISGIRRGPSPVAVDDESLVVFRATAPGESASLTVGEFGRHRIAHTIRERRLPHYVLVFVEHGRGRFRGERGVEHEIHAPAVFWLVPGIAHSYGPSPGTAWTERWAVCRGALIDELRIGGLIEAAVARRVSPPDAGALKGRFDELESAMSADGRLATAMSASIVHALTTWVAQLSGEAFASPPPIAMARLVDELRHRAFGDVDFRALAAENGISAITLRRRFRRYTGMTPKAFQLHVRLERARRLLVMSDRSVDDIAHAAGFRDAFYFSRLFSARIGTSPSEFRRMHDRRDAATVPCVETRDEDAFQAIESG